MLVKQTRMAFFSPVGMYTVPQPAFGNCLMVHNEEIIRSIGPRGTVDFTKWAGRRSKCVPFSYQPARESIATNLHL